MNNLTIARLSTGLFVLKGQVFDTLTAATFTGRRNYPGVVQVVRDASPEENVYWQQAIQNSPAFKQIRQIT